MTLILIALALAMDVFAVAIASGVILSPINRRQLFRLSFHFGLFQGIMPIIGWLAGLSVQNLIKAYDHWIAFGLLSFIGCKMMYEALRPGEEERPSDPTRGMTMVMLSIATSIDALAVGLTLGMIGVSIWIPALVIGVVAGVMTCLGMMMGEKVGLALGRKIEILGGLVLIGIGVKILFEHLFS